MFAHDALTVALDALDVVVAQLRESRAHERTARFYSLRRVRDLSRSDQGVVATVIELNRAHVIVSWLGDGYAVYATIEVVREALVAEGVYLLVLEDASERRAAPGEQPDRSFDLTEREKPVVRLLGQGLTNGEIAARLGMRESTIKNRLSKIYAKLLVHDRVQAALMARDLASVLEPSSSTPA